MKLCIHCAEFLPYDSFGKDSSTPDGARRWCKNCTNEGSRKKYKEHPEFRARLQKRYGITEGQYATLKKFQKNSCMICGAKPERLVVDHDHETNQVRGLLCRPCNFMLGNSKESPEILRRGAIYLEHRQQTPVMVSWQEAQKILKEQEAAL